MTIHNCTPLFALVLNHNYTSFFLYPYARTGNGQRRTRTWLRLASSPVSIRIGSDRFFSLFTPGYRLCNHSTILFRNQGSSLMLCHKAASWIQWAVAVGEEYVVPSQIDVYFCNAVSCYQIYLLRGLRYRLKTSCIRFPKHCSLTHFQCITRVPIWCGEVQGRYRLPYC